MVARSKIIYSCGASLAALAVFAPMSALAQATADSIAAPEVAGDEGRGNAPIIVTGTRIAGPETEMANPITSLTAVDIARSGKTNLTDILADTPALVDSITTVRTAGGRADLGGVGVNLLNLRHLGTQRTLVLVNGRRHVASLAGSAAVDINTIPIALVERVDILTGGVSAIYGADGVSGVVNFVLKRDFEGIEARAQNGISSRGDAGEQFVSLTAGKNFAGGAGNIAISYEYSGTERLRAEQRRFGQRRLAQNLADLPDDPNVPDRIPYDDLRISNLSPGGGIDIDFDGRPDFTGSGALYDPGLFIPNSQGLAQGGDGTLLSIFPGDLQPRNKSHNVSGLFSYEFSPAARIFAEGKYVSTEGYTEGEPAYDPGAILYGDNAYLPDSVKAAMIPGILKFVLGPDYPRDTGALEFRSHYDLGRLSQLSKRETVRSVIGMDGEMGGHARYEVSYTFGQTKDRFVLGGGRIVDRYFSAIDAVRDGSGNIVCRATVDPSATFLDANYGGPPMTFTGGPSGNCVPLNIFGTNVASPAALAFVSPDLVNHMKLTQHVVTGSVAGDLGGLFELPGGPLTYAVGGEYRKEKSSFVPDQFLQQGVALEAGQTSPESGGFDVWEGFAEVRAPILRDVPGARLLEIGAALRLSDYSTVGSTTTWNVNGTYAPFSDLRLRATYSESVRAPNITELFAAQTFDSAFIADPCDVFNLAAGSSSRAANCATLLTGLGIDPATFNPSSSPLGGAPKRGLSSGNPALGEETAKTWTAGFVFTPSFVPGLAASFDWYDIKLKGAINTPRPQQIAELCVDQPSLNNPFCANISRDPGTGFIDGYLVAPANVSQFRSSGADFSVRYGFAPDPGWGAFNLSLAGGYLDQLKLVATPGADVTVQTENIGAPKWTVNFDLAWTKGDVTVNYGIDYFSKTRRFSREEVAANPDISDPKYLFYKEKWVYDIRLAVDIYDDRVTVYSGVNNLFDRHPDFDEVNYPVVSRGRFFYFGVKVDLDGLR